MENKLKNTGSILDHCRNCKIQLFEWEENGALCEYCILDAIEDSKKETINFKKLGYK
jgi:hypothetical protein